MSIKIYVKTHNVTGLKYLGKTKSEDPHSYRGSGKRWKLHIKKHGYDVTTEILRECISNEEVKEWGLYYSKLWNVVASNEWANLKVEDGDGGTMIMTETHRKKISESSKGRVFTEQHRKNLSSANKGKPDTRTPEVKAEAAKKASLKLRGRKKPDGFGENVSKRMTGSKRDTKAKEKMQAAWTDQRREEQSARRRIKNQERREECRACCLFCKNETTVRNIEKYHLDNCFVLRKKHDRIKTERKHSSWAVLSPYGIEYVVTNMREFCKKHGLNNGTMTEVALGNRQHHKGWKVLSKK